MGGSSQLERAHLLSVGMCELGGLDLALEVALVRNLSLLGSEGPR